MGDGLAFRLVAWSAWTPDMPEAKDWDDWAAECAGGTSPATAFVPPGEFPAMLRRRASPAGRNALFAASAMPDVAEARYVLTVRHGELARTVDIIDALNGGEELSPTEFSMSIHHGLTGLLSIATKNMRGHTAIAAGPESFCYGLLEAAACLAEQPEEPIVLLHYDEGLSGGLEALSAADSCAPTTILALNLACPEAAEGTLFRVQALSREQPGPASNHALDFLRFVASGEAKTRSPGRRMDWEWRRA